MSDPGQDPPATEFTVEVRWDESRRSASASLRQEGAPPRLYTADSPRRAARSACDAALRGLPDAGRRTIGRGPTAAPLGRALLWTAIVALTLSALIAIAIFLSADLDIDDDWQPLTTTFAIAVYCFLALGAAALLNRDSASLIARAGVAVSLAAGALAIVLIWVESADDNDAVIKTWAILTVAAVVAAHDALMLARARDDDSDVVRLMLLATIAVGLLLGALICFGILGETDSDGWARAVGSLGVLVALGTGLVPILRKLQD